MLTMTLLLPLTSAPPPTYTVTVDDRASHRVNNLFFGCHSDSGFTHQVRGFSSQMIFGESFEEPQANVTSGVAADAWHFDGMTSCGDTMSTVNSTVAPAMHGASSRRITSKPCPGDVDGYPKHSATPSTVLVNRGLGNEGFFLEAGKAYEGYFFAAAESKTLYPALGCSLPSTSP